MNLLGILLLLFIFVWLIIIKTYNWFSMYLFYLILTAIILVCVIVHLIKNPHLCLYPYNYYVEKVYGKKVFYSDQEKTDIFPSSVLLESNYQKIREEFDNLCSVNNDEENMWSNFSEGSDEFWKGWNTIVLRSFGKDNTPNMKLCPTLAKILKKDSNITTAIFSILEPGKTLHPHYGPFKGVLRYHMGIIVPPPSSGECYISVDGIDYDWKEGQGVLFDESYKHFATNQTDQRRVILFLDVKRPNMSLFNDILLYLISISPYNL